MIRKSHSPYFLIPAIFTMLLSACASPQAAPTADMDAFFTQVVGTLAMNYAQTALAVPTATNTPEPTFTPLASPTVLQPTIGATQTAILPPTPAGPTPLPINPATAYGCYNAAFVADVTVPAGTNFKSGDTFTKTWRLVNVGTCDWTGDFKIIHVSGDWFGSDTTKIRQRVGVGNTADISLDMVAPGGTSGTVVSNWQMATDDGNLFGPVLTVSIVLPGSHPTATAIGCYQASLVSETIPDGTKLDPDEPFTKTWQIENAGSCDWTGDFKITFVGGDVFSSDTTKIRKKVTAGSTVEISLNMVAPSSSGSFSSSWRMANDNGDLFGDTFTFEIVVR
jgi:Ig-like domain from next to BRCA1 gene